MRLLIVRVPLAMFLVLLLTASVPAQDEPPPAKTIQELDRMMKDLMDGSGDAEKVRELISYARDFFATAAPDGAGTSLWFAPIGSIAEFHGEYDQAREVYREIISTAARREQTDDPFALTAAKHLERLDAIGKPLDVAGQTIDGQDFDLSNWRGKVVLVDFWAPWCPTCMNDLPRIRDDYQNLQAAGYEVVTICSDGEKADIQELIKKLQLPFPTLYHDVAGSAPLDHPVAKRLNVTELPTSYLIDRDGKVAGVNLRGAQLKQHVEALLETAPQDDKR